VKLAGVIDIVDWLVSLFSSEVDDGLTVKRNICTFIWTAFANMFSSKQTKVCTALDCTICNDTTPKPLDKLSEQGKNNVQSEEQAGGRRKHFWRET
jgi:hypothetical protein